MAFTLMNEEYEFLCCLMMPSFNKDIRPHSQQLYSHQLLSIMSTTIPFKEKLKICVFSRILAQVSILIEKNI